MAGETEVLGENLPRRHFVHHKFHLPRPGIENVIVNDFPLLWQGVLERGRWFLNLSLVVILLTRMYDAIKSYANLN
jgi:hypothetical protein